MISGLPGFASGFVEEVLARTDLAALISEHVPSVQGSGDRLKCLCPFHQEKTPSFTISPSKGLFYCFGCHKGGNAITFVQEIEGLNSVEAIKYLARKAGLEIRYSESRDVKQTERQRALIERAAGFYQQVLLKSPKASSAREYLEQRDLSSEVSVAFRLGFAPPGWDCLCSQVQRWGFSMQDGEAAGLIVRNEKKGNYFDRFRDRIMFPITDVLGHVVGFGGRIMQGNGAKYINSPETAVFKKGRLLYGLGHAKQAIKEQKKVFVTEGYMDVLTLHQFGIGNAVGVLGTAMSVEHIRRLMRYAQEILLVFDSDTAGLNAAVKSAEILTQQGVKSRILTLPEGQDPDSFLRNKGVDQWQQVVTEQGLAPFEFRMRFAEQRHPGGTIEGRSGFAREMLEFLANVPSAVERSLYLSKLAGKLDVPQQSLAKDLERVRYRRFNSRARDEGPERSSLSLFSSAAESARRGILVLLLDEEASSELPKELILEELTSAFAGSEETQREDDKMHSLFCSFFQFLQSADKWEADRFLESLHEPDLRTLAAQVLVAEPPVSNPKKQWEDCIATLKRLKLEKEISEKVQKLEQNPDLDYLREMCQQHHRMAKERDQLWNLSKA